MAALRNTDLIFEAFDEGNRLWVALNLADAAVARTIESGVDRLAGTAEVCRAGEKTALTLPPHGWAILG
jgi:cyclomaltodextrinase